tara:strand:+ start:1463 stop:2113 length:651 start_codon:yes stop_codon:yes gene_type:complete
MDTSFKVAPSILSADFSNLGDEIKKLNETDCDFIHIDVMDGHFVPNLTIGPDVIKSIRSLTNKVFDVHLMMDPVKKYLKDFIKAGADILTVHHEISEDSLECLKEIKRNNILAGISIKPSTPSSQVIKYLEYVDLVLVMTVEPGFGGQKFLNSQIPKIEEIKKMTENKNINIEVDGGITIENARLVKDAGANILVSGSTIFSKKNYSQIIDNLRMA